MPERKVVELRLTFTGEALKVLDNLLGISEGLVGTAGTSAEQVIANFVRQHIKESGLRITSINSGIVRGNPLVSASDVEKGDVLLQKLIDGQWENIRTIKSNDELWECARIVEMDDTKEHRILSYTHPPYGPRMESYYTWDKYLPNREKPL